MKMHFNETGAMIAIIVLAVLLIAYTLSRLQ